LGLFVNGNAGLNLRKQFSAGGESVIGTFWIWDAGSNMRKQFSAMGRSIIGTFRKWGCRLKSAQEIFSRAAISYCDSS